MENPILVAVSVPLAIEKIWDFWNQPEHIVHWYYGSEDWHTPQAENDLRPGGRFAYEMKPKKGGEGFVFSGEYVAVIPFEQIDYRLDDGRRVSITFEQGENATNIRTAFEPEGTFPLEQQRKGWQAILDHFKMYAMKLGA